MLLLVMAVVTYLLPAMQLTRFSSLFLVNTLSISPLEIIPLL